MRALYTILLCLALPLILLRLLYRGLRARAYWQRWRERFGWAPLLIEPRPVLWCHAVSIGEVEASRPLIQALQRDYPDYQILITTMTPTGSARVKLHFSDTVAHCYLPYDFPFAVKRFLRRTRPQLGVIMETEIWPNLIHQCQQQNLPLILANARMSERSLRGYQRFSGLIAETLRGFSTIAAQTEDDKCRLISLGANATDVHAIGNLKYEMHLPASLTEQCALIRLRWASDRPVWIAASTHEGEEQQILAAAKKVRVQQPNALLIIVPRKPERFDRVFSLCQQTGFETIRRSLQQECTADTDVLLIDTMGELLLFYGVADVAFVGGSLVPHGGHNILEPAALGRAVLLGPYHFNFTEISRQFIQAGAANQVDDVEALATHVSTLLQDASARSQMGDIGKQLIADSRGASNRLLSLIAPQLPHG